MTEFEKSIRAWFADSTDANYERMLDLIPTRAANKIETAANEWLNATAWTLKHERAFDKVAALLKEKETEKENETVE